MLKPNNHVNGPQTAVGGGEGWFVVKVPDVAVPITIILPQPQYYFSEVVTVRIQVFVAVRTYPVGHELQLFADEEVHVLQLKSHLLHVCPKLKYPSIQEHKAESKLPAVEL